VTVSTHCDLLRRLDLAEGADDTAGRWRPAPVPRESVAISSESRSEVAEGWVAFLGEVDELLEAHSRRVVPLADQLAAELGASDAERAVVREGALLHDVGKLGLPASILRQRGELTRQEFWQMTWHPGIALWILDGIGLRPEVLDIPYCHHERWDGAGYPRGLEGSEIPLRARLFSIVDVWDALSHDRLYRAAWPRSEVVGYLVASSGKAFDPSVVSAFLKVVGEDESAVDRADRYGGPPASGVYRWQGGDAAPVRGNGPTRPAGDVRFLRRPFAPCPPFDGQTNGQGLARLPSCLGKRAARDRRTAGSTALEVER
jgi:hypothetical protein